jgi:hypothetical protein
MWPDSGGDRHVRGPPRGHTRLPGGRSSAPRAWPRPVGGRGSGRGRIGF